jgi:AcrR family transcriptional regulator
VAPHLQVAPNRTPSSKASLRTRSGGRSARVVADVLRTTLEVLGQEGYAGLRVDDVALRAGVNKTTIYRRWPTRADLVIAALTALAAPPKAVETGCLERDLQATFMTATSLRATPAGRGVVRVLIAERGDPEVDRVVCDLRELHRAPARTVLVHARRRGDLPRRVDIELLLDILAGTIYGRLRECPHPLDPQWVKRVVRLVLSGVAAGGRVRDPELT